MTQFFALSLYKKISMQYLVYMSIHFFDTIYAAFSNIVLNIRLSVLLVYTGFGYRKM
jgi:hypothetical protein